MQGFELVSLDKLELGTEVLKMVEETRTSGKSKGWSRAKIATETERR